MALLAVGMCYMWADFWLECSVAWAVLLLFCRAWVDGLMVCLWGVCHDGDVEDVSTSEAGLV
jgi:hypothetical protein